MRIGCAILTSSIRILYVLLIIEGSVEAASTVEKIFTSKHLSTWNPVPLSSSVPIGNNPGENGTAVKVPPEYMKEANESFVQNQFNVFVSNLIALNRSLIDSRPKECEKVIHPIMLPTASIVIVFHNEAWSTLLRSITSVINKSPVELIHEIILVDDASDASVTHLRTKLEKFIEELSVNVKIHRTINRVGLIRARLIGAELATAPVLVFLDSHVECNTGWLEPLLSQIASNRHSIVSPVIDVISDETFEYIPVKQVSIGGFDWQLNFKWFLRHSMSKTSENISQPVVTPAMAGGLFAVDRQYFYDIGSYDEGMEVWGAENLEISFRVWMCGGQLLIHPCSRVGHVFRKKSPYTFPGGTSKVLNRNKLRLGEVWMDEWLQLYKTYVPSSKSVDAGDIEIRKRLREDKHCNSFKWYLRNIYPETDYPLSSHIIGTVINVDSRLCLDTQGKKHAEIIGVTPCHNQGAHQVWAYTSEMELRSGSLCLDAVPGDNVVKLWKCHGLGGHQAWLIKERKGKIQHKASRYCMSVVNSTLSLGECENTDTDWVIPGEFVKIDKEKV